jgi:hypothetical protein
MKRTIDIIIPLEFEDKRSIYESGITGDLLDIIRFEVEQECPGYAIEIDFGKSLDVHVTCDDDRYSPREINAIEQSTWRECFKIIDKNLSVAESLGSHVI